MLSPSLGVGDGRSLPGLHLLYERGMLGASAARRPRRVSAREARERRLQEHRVIPVGIVAAITVLIAIPPPRDGVRELCPLPLLDLIDQGGRGRAAPVLRLAPCDDTEFHRRSLQEGGVVPVGIIRAITALLAIAPPGFGVGRAGPLPRLDLLGKQGMAGADADNAVQLVQRLLQEVGAVLRRLTSGPCPGLAGVAPGLLAPRARLPVRGPVPRHRPPPRGGGLRPRILRAPASLPPRARGPQLRQRAAQEVLAVPHGVVVARALRLAQPAPRFHPLEAAALSLSDRGDERVPTAGRLRSGPGVGLRSPQATPAL
mmetsp:Transcript_11736/g.36663  ORF Transcript_11736/g.36663 Transcript_11736/m.36663 type:complete len:315 (+) Transcript_11736:527-1471(+)